MSDGICLIIHLEYHLRTLIMHNVYPAERIEQSQNQQQAKNLVRISPADLPAFVCM